MTTSLISGSAGDAGIIRIAGRFLLVCVAAVIAAPAQTQNEVVAVGFTSPFVGAFPMTTGQLPTFSPGTVVTLFTTPLGVPDAAATQTPLPRMLSGVSVLTRVVGAIDAAGYPASVPLLRIDNQQGSFFTGGNGLCTPDQASIFPCSYTAVTVQIPAERVCAAAPLRGADPANCEYIDVPPLLILNVRANGVTGPDLAVRMNLYGEEHYLNSCDSIFGPQLQATCHPLVTHADGSFVTTDKPAKVGEVITIYAVGFGSPLTASGYPATEPMQLGPFPGVGPSVVVFRYPYQSPDGSIAASVERLVTPLWYGLIPGFVGLYQINVAVPSAPGGQYYPCSPTNATVAPDYANPSLLFICVQP